MSNLLRPFVSLFRFLMGETPPKYVPGYSTIFDKELPGGEARKFYPSDCLQHYTETKMISPDFVGTALVTKIEYCKCLGGWEHEFLVAYVRGSFPNVDSERPIRSYLVIQRLYDPKRDKVDTLQELYRQDKQSETSPHPNSDSQSMQSSSASTDRAKSRGSLEKTVEHSINKFGSEREAVDHISIYRTQSSLDKDLKGMGKFTVLSTITFPENTPFNFEQLVMICKVVSEGAPNYNLLFGQCYWYAYSVWAVVKSVFQDEIQVDKELKASEQGTCKKLNPVGGGSWRYGSGATIHWARKPAALAQAYRTDWEEFSAAVERLKADNNRISQVIEAERARADRAEQMAGRIKQDKDEEIRRLKALLESHGIGSSQ